MRTYLIGFLFSRVKQAAMQAENFESYSPKRPTRPGYLIALAAVCGHLFDFLSNNDLVAFTKAI